MGNTVMSKRTINTKRIKKLDRKSITPQEKQTQKAQKRTHKSYNQTLQGQLQQNTRTTKTTYKQKQLKQ